ncbi:MAG: sulfite exporter TauE/SafE family protein [Clostridiales bacterium]|jgi:uncharacterized membrane protein YfcA|nr:sulfite exporter TauE/SafE family protein [Clostridiales bacterium]
MTLKIILFVLIGAVGGLIGGMGMGGGTLLIPLLTMLTETEQHAAQAVNLIAFIPMSAVALIIHIKNGLVEFKYLPLMAVPAVVSSVFSAILARRVEAGSLRMYFGIFLIVLGVWQLSGIVRAFVKKRRAEKRKAADLKRRESQEKITIYKKR